jgi:toxin-antitoxin system PIN domain toxin
VIIPDLNLLIYAYNKDAPHHGAARDWWQRLMSDDVAVAIPWAVSLGFVRLMTHTSVLKLPLTPSNAIGHVRSWLERPGVAVIEPGARHLAILEQLLDAVGVAGRLTTDAHLAALAIENQAELHSNDVDFGRFPGLRWRNPIREA